jgi:hypothetical protein
MNVSLARSLAFLALTLASLAAGSSPARAEDFYFVEGSAFPGVMLRQEGNDLREVHRRPSAPRPAALNPVPKIASLTFGAEGTVYFCSGLDGCIFAKNGDGERLFHEDEGQIRHVAFNPIDGCLWYSIVNTPVDSAPLADGVLRARNLVSGQVVREIPVRQREVGNDWWGQFTFHSQKLYVATLGRSGSPATIFDVRSEGPVEVFRVPTGTINGMAVAINGDMLLATGGAEVIRLREFRDASVAFTFPGRRITGLGIEAYPAPRR